MSSSTVETTSVTEQESLQKKSAQKRLFRWLFHTTRDVPSSIEVNVSEEESSLEGQQRRFRKWAPNTLFKRRLSENRPKMVENKIVETLLRECEYKDRIDLYKECFLGSQFVDVVVNHRFADTREDAVRLLRKINRNDKIFSPVDAGICELEDDGWCFYRFREEWETGRRMAQNGEKPAGGGDAVAAKASFSKRIFGLRGAKKLSRKSKQQRSVKKTQPGHHPVKEVSPEKNERKVRRGRFSCWLWLLKRLSGFLSLRRLVNNRETKEEKKSPEAVADLEKCAHYTATENVPVLHLEEELMKSKMRQNQLLDEISRRNKADRQLMSASIEKIPVFNLEKELMKSKMRQNRMLDEISRRNKADLQLMSASTEEIPVLHLEEELMESKMRQNRLMDKISCRNKADLQLMSASIEKIPVLHLEKELMKSKMRQNRMLDEISCRNKADMQLMSASIEKIPMLHLEEGLMKSKMHRNWLLDKISCRNKAEKDKKEVKLENYGMKFLNKIEAQKEHELALQPILPARKKVSNPFLESRRLRYIEHCNCIEELNEIIEQNRDNYPLLSAVFKRKWKLEYSKHPPNCSDPLQKRILCFALRSAPPQKLIQHIENCNSTVDLTEIIKYGQHISPQLRAAAYKRKWKLDSSTRPSHHSDLAQRSMTFNEHGVKRNIIFNFDNSMERILCAALCSTPSHKLNQYIENCNSIKDLTEIINCGPSQYRKAAKKRRGTLSGSSVDFSEESFEIMWRRLGETARPEVRARVRLQYIENCNSIKDLTKIIEYGQDISPQLLTAAKKRRGTLS